MSLVWQQLSPSVPEVLHLELEPKRCISTKRLTTWLAKIQPFTVIDGVSHTLVEEAGCGMHAEPENIVDIVQKIELVASDLTKCKTRSAQGYIYAKKHFDRHVLARKYIVEIQTRLTRV